MNYSNISSDKMQKGRHSFAPYSDSPYICHNGVKVNKSRWSENNPVVHEQRSIIYPSTETDELLPMFDLPAGNYKNNHNYSRNNLCR